MADVLLAGLPLDNPYSGTAVYARNLLRHLPLAAPDLSFRTLTRQSDEDVGPGGSRINTPLRHLNRGRGIGARLDKLSWETVALPLVGALGGDRLIHSLYFAAPPLTAQPVVVTIHDLVPLILPGYHRGFQSRTYSRIMAWTARRAEAVITVSEYSRNDIVRVLGIPPSRVVVTYEATDERYHPQTSSADFARIQERYGLPEHYLLYVGSAERRKNLETLVRAFALAAGRLWGHDVKLVLVTSFPRPDELYPDTLGLMRELGLGNRVVVLSCVDEGDLPAVFRHALAFCFPSVYEGFGLPAVEAMASGVPVLASDSTSLSEVVGNAGLLLPCRDVGAWADALGSIVTSEHDRRELIAAGLRRASQFSWLTTASETAKVYRRVLGT